MKIKILSAVYFIIGITYLVIPGNDSFIPGFVLKILIIPVLMLIFAVNLFADKKRLHMLMFAGLFFSWAGDVLLEIPGSYADLFIPGLVCFLLAHLMYLTVFFSTPGNNVIFRQRIYLVLPVLLYGAVLIYYLYHDLDGMRIPVILYAVVILTMLSGAINRLEKVNRLSYWLVLAGAILFVISDSCIAVNKFSHHIEHANIWVMVTYITAQFLIIYGYIRQYRDRPASLFRTDDWNAR
jgi:uncharacterized membrane protein YhhN